MDIHMLQRRVLASRKLGGLVLDDFPGAAAAFSLRKLRADYSGFCIEVRRSSDDTDQNIGFVGNELDTDSLLSFVGAGDGFVRTWYDQSLNSSNISQDTTTLQPQIVEGGSIIIDDDLLPAIRYNKTTLMSSLRGNLNLTSSDGMIASVFQTEIIENQGSILGHSSTGGAYLGIIDDGSGVTTVSSGLGSPLYYKNADLITSPTRDLLHTNYNTGSKVLAIVDNLNFSANAVWNTNGTQPFVYAGGSSFRWELLANEYIIWQGDQSSNRTGIQENIRTHYNMTF